MRSFAKIGSFAGSLRNANRDLLRKLSKHSKWPAVYWAPTRTWNRRRQEVETVDVPVLLPHEVLAAIADLSDMHSLSNRENLTATARSHIATAESQLPGGPPIVPLALWLDGTPCNWDRNESVDSVAFSLPGVSQQHQNVRLAYSAVLKTHCVTQATVDDFLNVFVWSLRCLAMGAWPTKRHDDLAWRPDDRVRRGCAGQGLAVRALLVETRGDWAGMTEIFRLPGWQEKAFLL